MGFYSPSYGGISDLWYRNAAMDAVWTNQCDQIVARCLRQHAPFLLAHVDEVREEIRRCCRTDIKKIDPYWERQILTRAYAMPVTREIWLRRLQKLEGKVFTCFFCGNEQGVLEAHPSLIGRLGPKPRWCRDCDYIFGLYHSIWSADLRKRINAAKRTAARQRTCALCGAKYNLLRHFFSQRSLYHAGKPLDLPQFLASGSADFLYPNLYAPVCFRCFEKAFGDSDGTGDQAELLHTIFLLTGEVPNRSFDKLMYFLSDAESIINFIRTLGSLRSPEGLSQQYGSFFKALIAANVLPEGSRKMVIGTMTQAKDGHLCMSLPEKRIDDYLCSLGIAHRREVRYPGSAMRCDWELRGKEGSRVFVEYFGMMSSDSYASKAYEKIDLARKLRIPLIELYPETDWKRVLRQWQETCC